MELGPCGEKVGYYDEVPENPVPPEMGSGAYIRWLISEKDGAPTFYMRLFRLEAGAHIAAHFHPWEHEIFILEGSGRIRIGSKIYNVREGVFLYIPANVEHEYWADTPMRFLCMIPARPSAEKLESPRC
jgi:quercetin dioxygenase-like cupin family protein